MQSPELSSRHETVAPRQALSMSHTSLPRILKARLDDTQGVVVFPPSIGWANPLFQRPQQLARAFAKRGFLTVLDCSNSPDEIDGLQEVEFNLFLFRGFSQELHALPKPIIWTFTYNFHLSDNFPTGAYRVYDWIDDLSVFSEDPSLLQSNHLRALREADLVTVVARRLHEEALIARPDAVYLPNGVDYEHFADPSIKLTDDPEVDKLRRLGRPIAGYYGALAEWFDYELLFAVARMRPDWSFLLIGPEYPGFRELHRQAALELPNVVWIENRKYEVLNTYLQAFDVATIPFRINKITLATSPIKLYEYLAGGKPVVATPLPECRNFHEVHIAESPEKFSRALDIALAESRDMDFREHLRSLSQGHSWEARIDTVIACLKDAQPQPAAETSSIQQKSAVNMRFLEELTGAHTRARELELALDKARKRFADDLLRLAEAEARNRTFAERLREQQEIFEEQSKAERDAFEQRLATQRSEWEARLSTVAMANQDRLREIEALLRKIRGERNHLEQELEVTRQRLHEFQAVLESRLQSRLRHWLRHQGSRSGQLLKKVARRFLRWWFKTPVGQPVFRNWYQYRFDRYRQAREESYGLTVGTMRCPSQPGLVSIVLPVYNGEHYVSEVIESILSQTYSNFELIIVNDGSADDTPEIVDSFAARDHRIRAIHQKNQKLPRSLSNGFRVTRGEFLTWISDDNRLKPQFLERMVDCLRRHPDWDMVYANIDIIGENGEPLCDSHWYSNYQVPPGSPHVHFPSDTAELNTWPNQYIGPAFLYRDRVAALVGDYSPMRFTVEDYDYFMLVNELLTLSHSDFNKPVYEYRFHSQSLTAKEKELKILKLREHLMVFDDFRQDFNLTSILWLIDPPDGKHEREVFEKFASIARAAGHLIEQPGCYNLDQLPRLWFPAVFVDFSSKVSSSVMPPKEHLPANTLTVLTSFEDTEGLPINIPEAWHMCLVYGASGDLSSTGRYYQGWYGVTTPEDLFRCMEIRARSHHLKAIEQEIVSPHALPLRFSVVICTYQRSEQLIESVRSAANQSFDPEDYEVLVVNNDPWEDLSQIIEELRQDCFASRRDHLRLVLCPFKGLSHARNAGISEARGEIVCFLDDDAVALERWLEELDQAYVDERAGVVGGKILVQRPTVVPKWLENSENLTYWSHFNPGYREMTWVEDWSEFPWGANWTARRQALLEIGGFRCNYGRKGDDFGGGEEVVAASLAKRLGYKVGILPTAVVYHNIDNRRFTKQHVKKTIRAATLVNYRLQTDLYVPHWLGPGTGIKKMADWLYSLLRYPILTPFKRLDMRYNFMATMHLLWIMAKDYRARASSRWLSK